MSAKRNVIAFFIISIIGTLSHFVYKWTGKPYLIGLFFPVNESTWEHLKLLFFPSLIYFAVVYFTLKEKPKNYISATAISIIAGMLSIVVMFYTYQGVLGRNIDFLNILIYFLGVTVTVYIMQRILKTQSYSSGTANIISLFFLLLTAILFVSFSFNPPSLGIFLPPAV
jgi:hypothetical protein